MAKAPPIGESGERPPVIVKKFPRVVSFPKKIKAVGRKYTSCSSVREISIGSRRIRRHSFCSTTAKKLRWKRMGRVRLPTRTRPPVTLEVAPVKNALWVSCTLPAKVNMPKASINSVGNGSKSAALAGSSSGLSEAEVKAAQNRGAEVAVRGYSREFELEADALGAEIALIAGFDPIRGAGFFDRLPEPGNRFLGSHPPNAQRKAVVVATVRRLKAS